MTHEELERAMHEANGRIDALVESATQGARAWRMNHGKHIVELHDALASLGRLVNEGLEKASDGRKEITTRVNNQCGYMEKMDERLTKAIKLGSETNDAGHELRKCCHQTVEAMVTVDEQIQQLQEFASESRGLMQDIKNQSKADNLEERIRAVEQWQEDCDFEDRIKTVEHDIDDMHDRLGELEAAATDSDMNG